MSGDGDETNAADGETPDLDTIYDPVVAGEGDELTVGGGQGQGEGGTVGATDGPTQDGASRVPVAEAITDYSRQATEAMDGVVVAPSDRQLVTDYFDHLQNRS